MSKNKLKFCECGKSILRGGMLIVFNWQQVCRVAGWNPKDSACAGCIRKVQATVKRVVRDTE
jgi:hypothetical protein